LELLFRHRGHEIYITEAVLMAAAGNTLRGHEIIEILLIWRGDEVHVTEAVLIAAARNRLRGYQIIKLLIDGKGEQANITEAVITAATKGDDGMGAYAVRSLLHESKMKREQLDNTACHNVLDDL
jgi:hypothetical protein